MIIHRNSFVTIILELLKSVGKCSRGKCPNANKFDSANIKIYIFKLISWWKLNFQNFQLIVSQLLLMITNIDLWGFSNFHHLARVISDWRRYWHLRMQFTNDRRRWLLPFYRIYWTTDLDIYKLKYISLQRNTRFSLPAFSVTANVHLNFIHHKYNIKWLIWIISHNRVCDHEGYIFMVWHLRVKDKNE